MCWWWIKCLISVEMNIQIKCKMNDGDRYHRKNSSSSRTLAPRPHPCGFFRPFCTIIYVSVWAFIFLKCMHLLVCASFCFPSPSIPFDCVSFPLFVLDFSPSRHISKCICYAFRQFYSSSFSLPSNLSVYFTCDFLLLVYYQCRWSVRNVPKRSKYLWQMKNKLLHKMCLLILYTLCASVYDLARCIYVCMYAWIYVYINSCIMQRQRLYGICKILSFINKLASMAVLYSANAF